jgi:multiple antibiotic resistance protein
MVFARESGTRTSTDERAESRRRADISVFPLAFPLIAGPGALVTVLLWVGPVSVTEHPVLFTGFAVSAALVLLVTLGMMLIAGPLMRAVGITGANVANRLFGVVLGALSVQFVLDGLRSSF